MRSVTTRRAQALAACAPALLAPAPYVAPIAAGTPASHAAPILRVTPPPTAVADTGFTRHTLTIDGRPRSYLVRVPARPLRAGANLVLMLHGGGGSAAKLIGLGRGRAAPYRQWVPIAEREGLVLVAPDGLGNASGTQGWNDCRSDATDVPTGDDVRFLLALADTVARRTGATPGRLLVVGTSNGGMMTLRLAIEAPSRVAAAAPIVASMPARSECRAPTVPVPMLLINGTADPLVPYAGGQVAERFGSRGSVVSVDSAVATWRTLAGLCGPPVRERLPSRRETPA
ncbi:MAG: alpha/beta fold hydrolase, partial [Gemmatimonadaceae bacterium]|nr:alpha/beta fold hydrolase [Gemmatimonadaceae bacterium]